MGDRNPFDDHASDQSRVAEFREMDRNAASWRRAETGSVPNHDGDGFPVGRVKGRWSK